MNTTLMIQQLPIKVGIFIALLTIASCKEEAVDFQTNECKKQPAFIKKMGFNPARAAFSTSEKKLKGLVLMEFNQQGDTTNGGRKVYQHPSWKTAGYLGPLQIDPTGRCFLAPIPVVNLIDNPPAQQNNIYTVDPESGEMKLFMQLPVPEKIPSTNPYGIVGFAYLCESSTLYASTLLGSERNEERGGIFAIDATSGKIIDQIKQTDVLGLGISYISGKRTLYFGSARNSDVYSITLNKDGKFSGSKKLEFSLDGLGPRGDDKVRRIKFDKNNQMLVYAIEFNYNLTAPTEKQESIFTFRYNEVEDKWDFIK
ncbi:MAG: hypothetical protein ACOYKE_03920 [Ferruginibacter sp.]